MLLIEQDRSGDALYFPVGNKTCGTCKATKRLDDFPKSRTGLNSDGFAGRCKECNRARNRLHYQAKGRSDSAKRYKTEVMHYGIDEKYGEVWGYLSMALWSMRNDCSV